LSKHAELEAALAKAESAQTELEAVLLKAEAALVNTVTDAAKIDADRAEVNTKVEDARALCRRLRAALIEVSRARPAAEVRETIKISDGQKREGTKPAIIAPSPREVQLTDHKNRAGAKERITGSIRFLRRKTLGSVDIRYLVPVDDFVRSRLLRQAIELAALILAYLLYFQADVQLEIMVLPSIVP
jgi:hypothetical protein